MTEREFRRITDKEAIEGYKKLIKKLPNEALKEKFQVGKRIIGAEDILTHLKSRDEIGKALLFAVKLHLMGMDPLDWSKEIRKNINAKRKRRRFKKDNNVLVIFSLPTSPQKKYYKKIQRAFEIKITKVLPKIVENYPVIPIILKGKQATQNCLEDAIDKYQHKTMYFSTITEGDPFGIWGQGSDKIITIENNYTKQICSKNHFHFEACLSGSFLAKWMVFNGTTYVHAYPTLWWRSLTTPGPFVDASFMADEELLDGETHSIATESCRAMYFEKARELKDQINPCIFLILNGLHVSGYGPGSESTLYDEEIPSGAPTMHINKIEMEREIQNVGWFRKIRAKAVITAVDEQGKPVPGATVSGLWSGNAINRGSEVASSSGRVTLLSDWYWSRTGKFIFTVKSIEHKDKVYTPEKNKETSDSIRIGRRW